MKDLSGKKQVIIVVAVLIVSVLGLIVSWYEKAAGTVLDARCFFGSNSLPIACDEALHADTYCGNLTLNNGVYSLECYLPKAKAEEFLQNLDETDEMAAAVRLTDADGERLLIANGRPVEMLLDRYFLSEALEQSDASTEGFFFAVQWKKDPEFAKQRIDPMVALAEKRLYKSIARRSMESGQSVLLASRTARMRAFWWSIAAFGVTALIWLTMTIWALIWVIRRWRRKSPETRKTL